jgi:hypothetical protein
VWDTEALIALQNNVAMLSAGSTLVGAVVVFLLLYLILERKKKTLIVVFLAALMGLAAFFGYLHVPGVSRFPEPVPPVVTAAVPDQPAVSVERPVAPVPATPARPHVKKKAAKKRPCPPQRGSWIWPGFR